MSPKKVFAFEKEKLIMFIVSVTTTTKYLLVKDEEVVYFWACIRTVKPRTSFLVSQSAGVTEILTLLIFHPFIPTSELCRNWMKYEVEGRNFRRSGFPADWRTKVHTYAKKMFPA